VVVLSVIRRLVFSQIERFLGQDLLSTSLAASAPVPREGVKMSRRRIAPDGVASACYFRSSAIGPERKALVQITERCNLHCAHCFVSAGREGLDMDVGRIEEDLLPQLTEARVGRVTLTGGEPFAHPDLLKIAALARTAGMGVTICTNATLIEPDVMDELEAMGGIQLNVSLDGFSAETHGKFRGAPGSFDQTVETTRALGERGLLKGVLVTPNRLAPVEEYELLCEFARECGAQYVLMNPLSSMGRGVGGVRRLGASEAFMRSLDIETAEFDDQDLELVRIRFPNDDKPLSACEAGTIIYVFAGGEVTVCPYLVFAARTPQSLHDPAEFIVGNVFESSDIAVRLDSYPLHERVTMRSDPVCGSCALADGCGRGCPAAVIATGGRLGDRDREQCPVKEAA
jgi:radical SAM protein with 4Fe4S-binding SPASM domain